MSLSCGLSVVAWQTYSECWQVWEYSSWSYLTLYRHCFVLWAKILCDDAMFCAYNHSLFRKDIDRRLPSLMYRERQVCQQDRLRWHTFEYTHQSSFLSCNQSLDRGCEVRAAGSPDYRLRSVWQIMNFERPFDWKRGCSDRLRERDARAVGSEWYRGLSLLGISLETQLRIAEVSSRLQNRSEAYTCRRLQERRSTGAKRAFKASLCGILSECRFTWLFEHFHLFFWQPASSTPP